MKDETNKKAHEASAQIACEGADAIRTVASLKREEGFYHEYCESLEGPLRKSVRAALWGSALFGMTQSVAFFGIALVLGLFCIISHEHAKSRSPQIFFYGSLLIANLSYDTKQFFICTFRLCVLCDTH